MIGHFSYNFKNFSKMKFFKEEYAIYLIDQVDSLVGLKELIGPKESEGIKLCSSNILF